MAIHVEMLKRKLDENFGLTPLGITQQVKNHAQIF